MLIRLPKPNNNHRHNTHQKTKHRNDPFPNTRMVSCMMPFARTNGSLRLGMGMGDTIVFLLVMMMMIHPARAMVMVPFKVPKHKVTRDHLDGGSVDEHPG
jgi:hypothetical protein